YIVLVSCFVLCVPPPPCSTFFPYTTLFRSYAFFPGDLLVPDFLCGIIGSPADAELDQRGIVVERVYLVVDTAVFGVATLGAFGRSEEHTSELQSRENLVCRLLLEKKKNVII